MIVIIQHSTIKGTIQAPPSKSSSQRALAAALVSGRKSVLINLGNSQDEIAAIKIIEGLGASVKSIEYGYTEIESDGIKPVSSVINCHESGLSIRMFTPIIALSGKEILVNGEGSLTNRPMHFFDEVLPELGVKIKTNHGKLPITLQGPLQPKNIVVDGSTSSQFITGLLLAYSAAGADNVSMKVNNLKSKPYIDLTLDVMKKFGLNVPENKNYEEFTFHKNPTNHLPLTTRYNVESDWSNAAFLLVAGALAGPISVTGLDLTSTQADKAIIGVLMQANAGIAMEAKGIKVRPAEMNRFEFDASDCPDLFPPLVALAAYCQGFSMIKGVSRLIHKESNRALSLQSEFGKMGVKIELDNDEMIVHGKNTLRGVLVESHNDHRIAMALAIAALKADGTTSIDNAQAVNKSYPGFFEDLRKLGANVSLPIN